MLYALGHGRRNKQVITDISTSSYKGFTLEKSVDAGLATLRQADMAV
jgi:hypothetical protein